MSDAQDLLLELVHKMQRQVIEYLQGNQGRKDFVSDIIYMLDGPEQRAAEAAHSVNPMEWVGSESDCYAGAETIIGDYAVYVTTFCGRDGWSAEFDSATDSLKAKSVSDQDLTFDQAKSAAQADYERRVRSA